MSTREFETYLNLLVRLMPVDRAERESIRDELRSHLEDRFDELLSQKVPRDEALRRAIDELGDAARLAAAFVSLTRIQRRRRIMRFSSATLVVAVLALLALTAFWPDDPAVPVAVRSPLGPSVVQAQAPAPAIQEPKSKKSAIQQKLQRPIEAEFVDTPLKDVLTYLSEVLDVQFHVNRRAMEEANVTSDEPVSISLKEVKAETVLRLVLQSVDTDLDFVERDGFILVSTVEDLDRMTEVRVYNCRDLFALAPPMMGGEGAYGGMAAGPAGASPMAMGMPGMGGGIAPGGGGGLGEMVPQSKLGSLIQTAVESDTWDQVGGVGSISEFNGLLVVKQSARVHEKIDELLVMLRAAADLEPSGQ